MRWRGYGVGGGLLPCPVDDRIWIELCVLNDRLESLDGLLEIFDVPVIVIGGTEEEAGLRGQELHCCLRVDKRTLVVNFSLKDLFATINEILDDIDRHLDRLAVINAVNMPAYALRAESFREYRPGYGVTTGTYQVPWVFLLCVGVSILSRASAW